MKIGKPINITQFSLYAGTSAIPDAARLPLAEKLIYPTSTLMDKVFFHNTSRINMSTTTCFCQLASDCPDEYPRTRDSPCIRHKLLGSSTIDLDIADERIPLVELDRLGIEF